MNVREAKEKTMQYIRDHSGLELKRDYLGMSHIGRCARMQYDWFVNGKEHGPTDRAHMNCISGHMFEAKMLDILTHAGILALFESKELVAPFDPRFRGHIDGVTADGELVEIKTFTADAYRRIFRTQVIPVEYVYQIQTYMHYGNLPSTLFVAVSRGDGSRENDGLEFCFLNIRRDDLIGKRIEEKAKLILAAIDAGNPPICECGRCDIPQTTTYHQAHPTRTMRDERYPGGRFAFQSRKA